MSEHYDAENSRLIQAIRASGRPAPTERELRHINHGAQLLCEILVADFGACWPDGTRQHRIASGLSVEAITAWNTYRHKRESQGSKEFNPIGRKPVRRNNHQPSLDDPFTMTRPLCIVAQRPQKAYPLDRLDDWRSTFSRRFAIESGCDVRISARCHKTAALTTLPLKRGEFVTVHKVCKACLRWPFAYSAQAVQEFREILFDHDIEPTDEARRAVLLELAERGVS